MFVYLALNSIDSHHLNLDEFCSLLIHTSHKTEQQQINRLIVRKQIRHALCVNIFVNCCVPSFNQVFLYVSPPRPCGFLSAPKFDEIFFCQRGRWMEWKLTKILLIYLMTQWPMQIFNFFIQICVSCGLNAFQFVLEATLVTLRERDKFLKYATLFIIFLECTLRFVFYFLLRTHVIYTEWQFINKLQTMNRYGHRIFFHIDVLFYKFSNEP